MAEEGREGVTRYVVGFMFTENRQTVVLIRKKRPAWQLDRWNGVGGHVERDETPQHAMQREFMEETGVNWGEWCLFCTLHGAGFEVCFFSAFTDRAWGTSTQTDEEVYRFKVAAIDVKDLIPNLRWLIPMALSFSRGETALAFTVTEER